jgi:50S ribosome-binding GTPase
MISAPDKRPFPLTPCRPPLLLLLALSHPSNENPARTLKAKIAKLKSELINGPGGKSAGSKDAGRGFDVSKSGDTRIGLVGFPSVGKSTLLTQLTGTRSAVSEIEFTTLTWCVGAAWRAPCEGAAWNVFRKCTTHLDLFFVSRTNAASPGR